ncbi:hypothetical protein [Burkholderia catarinensis]|uniref:hypothetical protein n=1 Tax=Burkholderia catarinensis TaxID=1108140 RepID=UPI000919FC5D|nr:hypothetical protein [Burkholderia catarinensis]KAG8150907.1 hypothetical protein BFF94_024000 [Burkholderia catarinensis]
MKLKFVAVAFLVLILCYLGAGAPASHLLLKPAVITDGLTLKAITYHWTNRFDREVPAAELLASRFYVLVLAAISAFAALSALKANRSASSFNVALGCAIALLVILIYAQTQAYYTVG